MERLLEQRYSIKFCIKLDTTSKETYERPTVMLSWLDRVIKLFREDRERVEGDDRSGRPSTSKTNENVLRVNNLLNSDRRMGIIVIADKLSIPQMQVFEIMIEKLVMRTVCAKLVSRVLLEEQKSFRKQSASIFFII